MAESAITIDAGLRALKAVQAVFPGAILAGGFLRDIAFGKTPKDIDIFVPYVRDFTAPMNWDGMSGAAEYMEMTEVDSIFNVSGFELPVQVIMLAPGLDVIERIKGHDFNFCQVWHDGVGFPWFTGQFAQAYFEKRVVLDHCENQTEFDRSMRRWDRLKQKYPEMTLVIPDRFKHFEGQP